MQKFCPTCGKRFPPDVTSCPDDDTPTYPVDHEDDLIGRVIDNRFTITSLLGAGGMGAVYRARQHSMNREVALKVMRRNLSSDEQAITRFHREAEAASRLTGPHAITVFDFGHTEDGLLYIVMELLNGRPLSRVVDDEAGPMAPARAVLITIQILDALAEAHAASVLHRDLKPDNVFLVEQQGSEDFVKVLDFGIAKIVGAAGTKLTTTGMIFGTPTYMSPEQAQGIEMDARGDLYSVGVILFELLAGLPPFEAKTPLALLHQKVSGDVPVIYHVNPEVQVPQELEKAVTRMMAIDPEDRPANVVETKQLLANAMGMSSSFVSAMPDVVISGGTTKLRYAGIGDTPPSANKETLQRLPNQGGSATIPPGSSRIPWVRIGMATVALLLGIGGAFWLAGGFAPGTPGEAVPEPVVTPHPATGEPAGRPSPGREQPVLTTVQPADAGVPPVQSDVPTPGNDASAADVQPVVSPDEAPAPAAAVATPEPIKKKPAKVRKNRPKKKTMAGSRKKSDEKKKPDGKEKDQDTDTLKLLFH